MPRLPKVLPFLVQKHNKTGAYVVSMPPEMRAEPLPARAPLVNNVRNWPLHRENLEKLLQQSSPHPLRVTATHPASEAINDLIAVVEHAFTMYDSGNHQGGPHQHLTGRIRDCFYVADGHAWFPDKGAGDERRRAQIARAMVIPFVCDAEAIMQYR